VLKGTSARRAAKLSWTAPNNGGSAITGYRLLRASTSNGSYDQIATPSASATSYTDTIPIRSTWYYRLVAVNSVGASPASNTVSVTAK